MRAVSVEAGVAVAKNFGKEGEMNTKRIKEKLWWLPNFITILGVCFVFAGGLLWFFRDDFSANLIIGWWAVIIGTTGRILDLADGELARRLENESRTGKWLDPLADKIGVYFILLIFLASGVNPWILAVAAGLDYASTVLRICGISGLSARWLGKIKSLLQSFALACFPLAVLIDYPILVTIGNGLLAAAVLLAFVSVWQKSDNLANFLTCMNGVCGCLAICSAFHQDWWLTVEFLFAAGIFDVLDGIVARMLDTSDISGGKLDDSSDALSFGLAPGISIAIFSSFAWWGIAAGIIFTPAVWWRLRDFLKNGHLAPDGYFRGLPCPTGAGIVCIATVSGWSSETVAATGILTAILMVSFRIHWPKQKTLAEKILKAIPLEVFFVLIFGAVISAFLNSTVGYLWGMVVFYLASAFRPKFKPSAAT